MTDLLPCPFCGVVPTLDRREGLVGISCGPDSDCNKTGLCIAFSPAKEGSAIEAWNRRAAPTRTQGADEPRCQYCDGTGDVHSIDGEWRGECTECERADDAQPVAIYQVNEGCVRTGDLWRDVAEGSYTPLRSRGYQGRIVYATRDSARILAAEAEAARATPADHTADAEQRLTVALAVTVMKLMRHLPKGHPEFDKSMKLLNDNGFIKTYTLSGKS